MELFPEHVQRELQRAEEALDDAAHLYQTDRLNAATNRAYYAMFHAALAALASEGIRRPGPTGEQSISLAITGPGLEKLTGPTPGTCRIPST